MEFDVDDLLAGCDDGLAPGEDVPAAVVQCQDRAGAQTWHPIAREPGVQSIPAAHCSTRLQLPHSRPGGPLARRIGNTGTAQSAALEGWASPRRTSRRPGA